MTTRIIFLGMLGPLSAIPFETLLLAGADIRAVIVPAAQPGAELREMPVIAPLSGLGLRPAHANLLELAREHHVPTWSVGDLRHPASLAGLRAMQPELLVVSCFRHILPGAWLAVPPHGAWNLHPSLLPRLRGPDPLFWSFHENAQPGVSVHRMTRKVDAGPILAQARVQFPDGINYAEAERICAEAGAGLFCRALAALEDGRLVEAIQDESDAVYYPMPTTDDFVVTEAWTVRHAFNFLRAVSERGAPRLSLAGQEFAVRRAVDFSEGMELGEAFQMLGDSLAVRLADGVLRVMAQ